MVIRGPELGRRHQGLPHLALLGLAVAQHAVHPRALPPELEPERHAHRDRDALAERAGGRLDAGQAHPVRMALERAPELAEGDQPVHREEAGSRHAEVLGGDAVALREDEPIAVLPLRAGRVEAQAIEVEVGEDVDHGQRAAGMPGPGVGEHPEELHPPLARDGLELRHVHIRHQSSPSMNPAIASTCTPVTAMVGAYTISSAPHTSVPLASFVVPTTAPSSRVRLSLMRSVFALSGDAIRPSRMIKESPTTVQVKSPARNPLIGYVYQMRPT